MARKANDTEGRFVVTMPLYPEPWQADLLEKRFKIMEHLQNSLIAMELRKLHSIQHTKKWRELEKKILETEKGKRGILYKERKALLWEAGINQNSFESDMTPMQKHFSMHISAQVAHKTANDVWRAFEKVLFGTGDMVSFKKRGTLKSVGTKTNSMSINNGFFVWAGGLVTDKDGKKRVLSTLSIRMKKPTTDYELEAFSNPPATYRILKQWYRNKVKWYVQITFKGKVPQRKRVIGESRIGIDIGTSSIAIVSSQNVRLLELAPNIVVTSQKKAVILRKMDRSRRASNPENYNSDGTIKRGLKLTHYESHRYKILQGEYRALARREAAQRKYQHILLANWITSLGTEVYVENMDFSALQHRAKKTEISEKTGRFKRKKRFGKSLANRAPAMLISILDGKLKNLNGIGIHKVDKWDYKASQYDHTTGECHKKELSERLVILGNGDVVQRDMYSAWLIMNADETLKHPNAEQCNDTYHRFKELHDREVERIRNSEKKLSSFGIV